MVSAKIQCPGCHKNYVVKTESLENLAQGMFKCPKCQLSTPFSRLISTRVAPPQRPIPIPRPNVAGAAKKMPGAVGKTLVSSSAHPIMSLSVKETGKTFSLGAGTYTLGRDSNDSRASLRVAPDVHMSRLQATLQVSPHACVITPLAAVNPIMINGRPVSNGEPVRLKNGDKIFMGVTNLTVSIL